MNNVKTMDISSVVQSELQRNSQQSYGANGGEAFVDSICARLRATTKGYAQKFKTAQLEVDYKRQLMLALAESGLTTEEAIKSGLNFYRTHDEWMPTPAQFVDACKNGVIGGFPDAERAFVEYCMNYARPRHKWSHAAVRLAAIESGQSYDIQRLPKDKAFPIYERAYEIIKRRAIAGEVLENPIPKALPEEVHILPSVEERKEKLKEILDALSK